MRRRWAPAVGRTAQAHVVVSELPDTLPFVNSAVVESHLTKSGSGVFRLPEAPAEPDGLAKYFRGLGDPTRLRILELLSEGEASVGQLVARLELAQPKVSNHLACLRWCGFVAWRRERRTILYRLADPRVPMLIALARGLLRDNAQHVATCRWIDGPC